MKPDSTPFVIRNTHNHLECWDGEQFTGQIDEWLRYEADNLQDGLIQVSAADLEGDPCRIRITPQPQGDKFVLAVYLDEVCRPKEAT